MMIELIIPSAGLKMSILNLFFLLLNNVLRSKPAPCLPLCPFPLILAYPKYSQNKQIKYPKSTSRQPNLTEAFLIFSDNTNRKIFTLFLWTVKTVILAEICGFEFRAVDIRCSTP